MTRTRQAAAIVAAMLAMGVLAGCSGGAASAAQGQTLASTKSPVQLLRNEMGTRIPKSAIYGRITTSEQVAACTPSKVADGTDANDYVSYDATVSVPLDKASQDVRNTVLKSLSDDGWTKGLSPIKTAVRMHSTGSVAQIDIYANGPSGNATGVLRIDVSGPCVYVKDGMESAEVKAVQGLN